MDEVSVAVAAARAAGAILRTRFGQAHQVRFKGPIDIVTEADQMAEKCILEVLHRETPGYGVLSEETRARTPGGEARWIVDPLDGTVNYAHGLPRFCVSIALERAGQLWVSAIYDPVHEELFVAQRDCGAWLNSRAIRVSTTCSLGRAVVSTGFPYDAWSSKRDNVDAVRLFIKQVMALRATGSAALDLAAVACGRSDAHWEPGLCAYDVAAGALLVREAGGIVSDFSGGLDLLFSGEVLASNPSLHAQLLSYLHQANAPPSARR